MSAAGRARRITSTQNPRLKSALRLRGRRERDRRGLTLIDGVRETSRALAGGAMIREAFTTPAFCEDEECHAVLVELGAAGVLVTELGRDAFARLAYGDRLDGIIAVAEMPLRPLATLELPVEPLIAVIEGVEKPGNLGAMLRTADGAGVDAVIVAETSTDLFNPNVIRASLGTIFTVPVTIAATGEVLPWLRDRGISIIAARVDGSVEYSSVDYRGAVAIALGSEARGLSDAWAELAAAAVRVPMDGVADSLNVSVTAGILFYEARRQRRAAAGNEP
jgi:RNA methyltransferase, TrmH family